MSILIKGMEMPKCCGDCRFFAWSRGVGQHCAVASDITFHATIDGMDVAYERNGNCPLVPVPPHGRLIDADALDDGFTNLRWENGDCKSGALTHWGDRPHWCLTGSEIENLINAAPTIIEAEKGEA